MLAQALLTGLSTRRKPLIAHSDYHSGLFTQERRSHLQHSVCSHRRTEAPTFTAQTRPQQRSTQWNQFRVSCTDEELGIENTVVVWLSYPRTGSGCFPFSPQPFPPPHFFLSCQQNDVMPSPVKSSSWSSEKSHGAQSGLRDPLQSGPPPPTPAISSNTPLYPLLPYALSASDALAPELPWAFADALPSCPGRNSFPTSTWLMPVFLSRPLKCSQMPTSS